MRHFDELIENLKQSLFDRRHRIFIDHLAIFLHHLNNQKRIFVLIRNRIIHLVLYNLLDWPQRFLWKLFKESFVLLNRSVDYFSDDIAQKGCVCLTKLANIELVSVEWLDLFIVFLGHDFAELVKEDVLSLVYALSLDPHELWYCDSSISFFGKIEQSTSTLVIDLPRMKDRPGHWGS